MNPELNGVEMIMSERARQVDIKGFDEAHDDEHSGAELALAAICYAAPVPIFVMEECGSTYSFENPWPWDGGQPPAHPKDYPNDYRDERIAQLTKAGALIAAEIDRLLRLRDPNPGARQ